MSNRVSLKPRRVLSQVPEAVLKKDLEKYRQHAIKYGATDAKIIPRESILVDERVWAKCAFPTCHLFNACAQCPPHVMPFGSVDKIKELVSKYRYAIFIMLKLPPESVTWEIKPEDKIEPNKILGARDYCQFRDFVDFKRYAKEDSDHVSELEEIVSRIEAEAFFDGYHLALAFGARTCAAKYCKGSPCDMLSGGPCRFPYLARPAVQAMAMDVMQMAANVGWEIYPIGYMTSAQDVPHGTRLGVVLIH